MQFLRLLFAVLLGAILPLVVHSEESQADELCAPFKDGVVAPRKVQAMLSAAADGHLYRILPSTSRVGFCIDSGFTRVKAAFRTFHGGLSLWPDPGEEEQAMVVIKTDSLDTDGAILEHLLKSEHFFDVNRYPEILFASTGIDWNRSTRAVLKGNLTIRGVTRSVDLQVELASLEKQSDGRVERFLAQAYSTISRSDFGIGDIAQFIDDEVKLCLSVEAVRHRNQVVSSSVSSRLKK
jgi:polyisoprenoid-binding protein YceI